MTALFPARLLTVDFADSFKRLGLAVETTSGSGVRAAIKKAAISAADEKKFVNMCLGVASRFAAAAAAAAAAIGQIPSRLFSTSPVA